MKNLLKNRNKGFTLIEVMIVLAIAGLIMAIIFIAVPALQRNQRDSSRQNIVSRIKSEMETYASNNGGLYAFGLTDANCGTPAPRGNWNDFYCRYITANNIKDVDPSTGASIFGTDPRNYDPLAAPVNPPAPPAKGIGVVYYGGRCQANGNSVERVGTPSPTSKNYAIIIGLDRGGDTFCVDNG